MDEVLLQLLVALEAIGRDHEEIYDTDVREQMHDVIIDGFINPKNDFVLPDEFGMFSAEGNGAIRRVLERLLPEFRHAASHDGLNTPKERLSAFQNDELKTPDEGNYYDDFFGYIDPDAVV
jgi:hypothetical protein